MRTDNLTPFAAAFARLRAEFARGRRRFKAQPTALRRSIGLGAVAAVVALAYAATAPSRSSVGHVRGGERFPADDLITIRRALDVKSLPYRVDDRNRVEVAVDRLDEANTLVSALDVGHHSLSAIGKTAAEPSVWLSLWDKEQLQEKALNEELAEMIRRKDGISDATVRVNRSRSRGGPRPASGATAFVYLETVDDRELSLDAVESIQALIAGAVPEVKPNAVTVFDRTLRPYLDRHDPTVGNQARSRRRGEEMKQKILEQLDWIKGVQVAVHLVESAALAAPAPAPAAAAPAPVTDDVGLPPLTVGVNQPLELPSEADTPPRAPTAAVAAVAAPSSPSPAIEPAVQYKAKVWVKVPRTYYLKAVRNHEPSLEDLQPLRERVERMIKTAVTLVVPTDQLIDGLVMVDTIPDELPADDPPLLPESTDARRVTWWWVPAGVAGGATAVILAVAFGMIAARRPALRPAARLRDEHGRFKIDEASDPGPGPGPSERVRELIRLNPEAAASVLHRWTGQGGTLS